MLPQQLDLVIRGGELVTAENNSFIADIGIANGLIVQIGGELTLLLLKKLMHTANFCFQAGLMLTSI